MGSAISTQHNMKLYLFYVVPSIGFIAITARKVTVFVINFYILLGLLEL